VISLKWYKHGRAPIMNMKHEVNLHGIWRHELECHYVDLFHNGEWAKFLVVQFFRWLNCIDVL
jgi:hypothetical protein